jgi:hypothetical protein
MRVVAVLAVLVLAGCSSTSHKPAPNPLPSVAAALHCTYQPFGPPEELYTVESGSCGPYTLYRFASAKARDEWLTAAGDTVTVVRRGSTWVALQG